MSPRVLMTPPPSCRRRATPSPASTTAPSTRSCSTRPTLTLRSRSSGPVLFATQGAARVAGHPRLQPRLAAVGAGQGRRRLETHAASSRTRTSSSSTSRPTPRATTRSSWPPTKSTPSSPRPTGTRGRRTDLDQVPQPAPAPRPSCCRSFRQCCAACRGCPARADALPALRRARRDAVAGQGVSWRTQPRTMVSPMSEPARLSVWYSDTLTWFFGDSMLSQDVSVEIYATTSTHRTPPTGQWPQPVARDLS